MDSCILTIHSHTKGHAQIAFVCKPSHHVPVRTKNKTLNLNYAAHTKYITQTFCSQEREDKNGNNTNICLASDNHHHTHSLSHSQRNTQTCVARVLHFNLVFFCAIKDPCRQSPHQ